MDLPQSQLPGGLPVPVDDGIANHLTGMNLPDITLAGTDGTAVILADLTGCCVIYVYPMTWQPGIPLPDGWDDIPGARGCTPQSCSFRDHYSNLQALNVSVYGLSTQDTDYQREAVERLHLPFPLLSDNRLQLKHESGLPTFMAAGMELYKRLTLITQDSRIEKVFYPVFPPDKNAEEVLEWLRKNP